MGCHYSTDRNVGSSAFEDEASNMWLALLAGQLALHGRTTQFPVCLLTVHLYTTAAAAAVTRSLFVCP